MAVINRCSPPACGSELAIRDPTHRGHGKVGVKGGEGGWGGQRQAAGDDDSRVSQTHRDDYLTASRGHEAEQSTL